MVDMNLARHITVLWRFRAVVLVGLLLGIVLAVLAAYQVPSMERRGAETWSAESDVEVTQRGFPEGRVTLPSALGDPSTSAATQKDIQAFGDPGRFVQLALYYAQVAVSDAVRERLPEKPLPGQITARNVDATGNGQGWLPIIRLTTTSATADGAVKLNQDTIAALQRYLRTNQNDTTPPTPDDQRVQLRVLNQPAAALLSGRSLTISFLAFMLCLLAAVAVAHILENLRPRHESGELDVEPELEFDPPAVVGAVNGHGRRTAWTDQAHEESSSGRQIR
jgi:hypothetical protein